MTYPPELDTDDIDELASYIERRYPTEEIRIHDTDTIHFAYWDESHRVVSATLLDHIQAAGYRVLHTGIATVPRGATRRAWMECRKHESGEEVDKSDGITLSCDHCGQEYTPDEARTMRSSDRMMSGTPVIAAGTGRMGRRRSIARSS